MPELPEVESARRLVDRYLVGKVIARIEVESPDNMGKLFQDGLTPAQARSPAPRGARPGGLTAQPDANRGRPALRAARGGDGRRHGPRDGPEGQGAVGSAFDPGVTGGRRAEPRDPPGDDRVAPGARSQGGQLRQRRGQRRRLPVAAQVLQAPRRDGVRHPARLHRPPALRQALAAEGPGAERPGQQARLRPLHGHGPRRRARPHARRPRHDHQRQAPRPGLLRRCRQLG